MESPQYHLCLTDDEQRFAIQALVDLNNKLLNEGRYTDAVDEMLIKVIPANKKYNLNNIKRLVSYKISRLKLIIRVSPFFVYYFPIFFKPKQDYCSQYSRQQISYRKIQPKTVKTHMPKYHNQNKRKYKCC